MWSASAISRSTWTSEGHGDSDRLIGEPENHLSYPAYSNPAVLPHSPANAAGAPAYSFVFALHQMCGRTSKKRTVAVNCRTKFVRVPINSTNSVEEMMDTAWTIGCRLRLNHPKSRRRPK